MELRNKIKGLRKAKGYTLQELGDKVGVTPSTVRKWESGEIETIRSDKLDSLARALDVAPAYLMGWTEEKGRYVNYGNDPRLFVPITDLSATDFKELIRDPAWEAKILEVNPNEENPFRKVITKDQLQEEEEELINIYRKLDLRRRIKLLNLALDLESEIEK